jgi:hypothetical protein
MNEHQTKLIVSNLKLLMHRVILGEGSSQEDEFIFELVHRDPKAARFYKYLNELYEAIERGFEVKKHRELAKLQEEFWNEILASEKNCLEDLPSLDGFIPCQGGGQSDQPLAGYQERDEEGPPDPLIDDHSQETKLIDPERHKL